MKSFIETAKRLEFTDELVSKGAICHIDDLASRLQRSDRNAYELLNVLRDLGAPLYYCKRTKKYKYAASGRLIIKWVPDGESNCIK